MIKYIIDASFVLTALSTHSDLVSSRFKEILTLATHDKALLYTTHYFSVEVANALRYSYDSNELVHESLLMISSLPIIPFTLNFYQLSEVAKVAQEYKATVYDTGYHFLALILDGVFITCDKKYHSLAKDLGHIELI